MSRDARAGATSGARAASASCASSSPGWTSLRGRRGDGSRRCSARGRRQRRAAERRHLRRRAAEPRRPRRSDWFAADGVVRTCGAEPRLARDAASPRRGGADRSSTSGHAASETAERLRALRDFEVTATDGAARAGLLHTTHGDVPTPAFMPVGTKATVKTLDPDEVRAVGAHIVLGNTYHLYFRPGHELIAELGGLHRFMGWDGPILTDSGGYQVFSLRDTIAAVDDEGVTFRSVYDGAAARFTPELAAAIQAALGSDIAMCFDQSARRPAAPRPRGSRSADDALGGQAAAGGARARPAALRHRARRGRPASCAALDRGDLRARLRRQRDRRALDRREPRADVRADGVLLRLCCRPRSRATSWASATRRGSSRRSSAVRHVRLRPPDPHGRTGSALTSEGRLNLRNARFARDQRPLDPRLRLPGVLTIHPRVHPPSGQSGGTARSPAPHPA